MFRRSFFRLAAACFILPALRWVPMPEWEETRHEQYMRLITAKRLAYAAFIAESTKQFTWEPDDINWATFQGVPIPWLSSLSG